MKSLKMAIGGVCACLIAGARKWRVERFRRAKSRWCTWRRDLRRRFECRTR